MDAFKSGTTVRQIMPKPISGVVTERRLNDTDQDNPFMEHHVEFKDADGNMSARWFKTSEIEAVAGTKQTNVFKPATSGATA